MGTGTTVCPATLGTANGVFAAGQLLSQKSYSLEKIEGEAERVANKKFPKGSINNLCYHSNYIAGANATASGIKPETPNEIKQYLRKTFPSLFHE